MKETFEKRLRGYGEVAKDQIEKKSLDKELETVLNWQIEKASEASATGKLAQANIYEMQLEKQILIEELKNNIKELDLGKEIKEQNGRRVFEKDGKFVSGNMETVTIGELITDGEWDINYNLDAETIPRNIRKRYLIERTKIKLQRLLDDQIAVNEKESENVHFMKRDAYKKSLEEKETEKAGLLAEKMIRNLLKKVSLDLGGDFEINKADLYQDVNQKIDFIIRRNIRERGVRVEEDKKNTGIQFTINTREDVIKHKTKQVEQANKDLQPSDNIQDIILVSVPIKEVNSVYGEWKKDKKSGGPDKLWGVEERRRIFIHIMKGFLTPEEIKEYSEKIK